MTKQEIEQLNEIEPYRLVTDREEQLYRVRLQEGLSITDENPKSPWISIKDDLPCNHNELICSKEISEGTETFNVFAINEYCEIWVDYMVYENGKWRWNDFEPDFWMVPPKLQK